VDERALVRKVRISPGTASAGSGFSGLQCGGNHGGGRSASTLRASPAALDRDRRDHRSIAAIQQGVYKGALIFSDLAGIVIADDLALAVFMLWMVSLRVQPSGVLQPVQTEGVDIQLLELWKARVHLR